MTSIDFKKLLEEAKAQSLAEKVDAPPYNKQEYANEYSEVLATHKPEKKSSPKKKYSHIISPLSSFNLLTEKFRVGKEKISKVSYIPDYITEQEEKDILASVSLI